MSERIGRNSQPFTASVPRDSRLAELDGPTLAEQIGGLPSSRWPWGTANVEAYKNARIAT